MPLKQQLLETSKPLFFRNGVKSVTMDEIANALGISKKTIYQVYADKNTLIEDLIVSEMTAQYQILSALVNSSENPIHEMKQISDSMSKVFMQIQPVFFYDLKKYYALIYRTFQEQKNHWAFNLIQQNIQKGIELGYYRAQLDIPRTIHLRLKQLDELLFNPEYGFSQNEFIITHEMSFRYFIYGISTLKGHHMIDQYFQYEP